jgi:hypothetical protein
MLRSIRFSGVYDSYYRDKKKVVGVFVRFRAPLHWWPFTRYVDSEMLKAFLGRYRGGGAVYGRKERMPICHGAGLKSLKRYGH